MSRLLRCRFLFGPAGKVEFWKREGESESAAWCGREEIVIYEGGLIEGELKLELELGEGRYIGPDSR